METENLFKRTVTVVPPEKGNLTKPIYQRAFYTLKDVSFDFPMGTRSVSIDVLTTEADIHGLDYEVRQIPNASPYKRLLDRFDRLEKFKPGTVETIKKLALSNPGKNGVVIFTHGCEASNLQIPFGLVTSKSKDGEQGGILPADLVVRSIQDKGEYSYVVMLSCNPARVTLQAPEITIPLIYYETDNAPTFSNKPVRIGFLNI